MTVRKILSLALAMCMVWCTAAAATEGTQPEETAMEAAQTAPEGEAGTGEKTEAETAVQPAEGSMVPSGTEPAVQPAEEKPAQPSEETVVYSGWEQTAQPAGEPAAPPAEKPAAQTANGTPAQSAGGTEAQTAEVPAVQSDEAPAVLPGTVQLPQVTDGSMNPGESAKGVFAGGEEKVWALEIGTQADLRLKTEGLQVEVIIYRASDGHTIMKETAPEEGLKKEFRVTGGSYLVCFRSAAGTAGEFTWTLEWQQEETDTEPEGTETAPEEKKTEPEENEGSGTVTEPEADAANAETEPGEEGEQTEGEETDPAEEDLSEEQPESTEESGPEETEPEETEQEENEPEEASGDAEPTEAEKGETPGISVRLHSNLEDGLEALPGTEVVIRAEVTGTDRPCHLQWQYSPDGGETVLDVEGASGSESRYFRYILDETNMHYLWRVAVIFDPPEE